MNINVSILDQQLRGLAQRQKARIEDALDKPIRDEIHLNSIAFVVLCAKVMLDLSEEDAIETLIEGTNDFGVDAIEVGDLHDGEFVVTLIQGKYEHKKLEGSSHFPQSGVEKAILAVRSLFDPHQTLHVNARFAPRVEEIRSLILDGHIPYVRVLLCNNGEPWKVPEAQAFIDREQFGDRVAFEHVNHDTLVRILSAKQPVSDTLRFVGKWLSDDLQFVRVLIGKVPIAELARLLDTHGDRLLDRNIRRFLGLHGNRVNEAISRTLLDPQDRPHFFFYNNGITLICDRFLVNTLQREDPHVRIEGLQIINGGQTSKTIQATLRAHPSNTFDDAHVLVRLYEVPKNAGPSVQTITYAINSQNPVDLKDLRSGDERQKKLEMSMKDLGFDYRRQRSDSPLTTKDISVGTAAEAVLSVWRKRPHRAKFRQGELFDKSYDDIFTQDLSAAQLIIAVLLFRIAENKRKRPPPNAPELVRYASSFIAMLMGGYLLSEMKLTLDKLDHRTFERARKLVEDNGDTYFDRAVEELKDALDKLYGSQPVSPQRLAATFRRGDLFPHLHAPAPQAP